MPFASFTTPSLKVEPPAMHVSGRLPLAATSLLRPTSASRSGRPKRLASHSPRHVGAGADNCLPRNANATTTTAIAPPAIRLADALDECVRLDRELCVIENSGHARIGVFAKPLGDHQRCRLQAAVATRDKRQHLPEDPFADPSAGSLHDGHGNNYNDDNDDDVTSDPFFHRFFDETGQSTYELLLRARMRVLALTKMVHSRQSLAFVFAEVDLAESYARLNLWKQAHAHVMVAYEILKTLDATRDAQDKLRRRQQQCQAFADTENDDDSSTNWSAQAIEWFYEQQRDPVRRGEIRLTELIEATAHWRSSASDDSTVTGRDTATPISLSVVVFQPANLEQLFGGAPSLHWQQLLLRMERQSAVFQDLLHEIESRLSETLVHALRQAFTQLDSTRVGFVPLCALIQCLSSSTSSDCDSVCASLTHHVAHTQLETITWSELLHHSRLGPFSNNMRKPLPAENIARAAIMPRLQFFFGRFFLRRGQLDDAMRYLQLAIASQEQLHSCSSSSDSDSLVVAIDLVLAETLSVRFKQQSVVAQQHALTIADKWLQSTDGSRRVRAKALEMITDTSPRHSQPGDKLMTKKDAETLARGELRKEYAALSLVRPDATAIDDAIEWCTKAWHLQQQTHGADHITTARVHVTLAQIHTIRHDWHESLRCYDKAIAIYEAACHGPVPASAWLTLEIATIHHHHTKDHAAAAHKYAQVGAFFHSFALEFASPSDSTRRASCMEAINAWHQWLAVSSTSPSKTTMEEKKNVLVWIHDATVDGYGEFAIEAAESGRAVAQVLVEMGQLRYAESKLRTTWYIVESHFGPQDRRTRKARKELLEISSEIKSAALDGQIDDDHEWLTL